MQMSQCPAIKSIFTTLPAIASSDASVLIVGESGTGKELLAKLIHNSGKRSGREFVSINCAAIPEHLLEAELFGHKKGSFTGAISDRPGLFELADGGTVFLDEVGDMPLQLQSKILRALQEKKIRPVGGALERPVDFRIISATHRHLRAEIRRGRFREDLFYRLSVIPLLIPPLRERHEDILLLAERFLAMACLKHGVKQPRFSPAAASHLLNLPWHGNVRELENMMEHISVLHAGKKTIELHDIPALPIDKTSEGFINWHQERFDTFPTLAELSSSYMKFIMGQVGENQEEAARILGVSRRTLHRRKKAAPYLLNQNETTKSKGGLYV